MKMVPVVFTFTEIITADGEALVAMVPQTRYEKVARRQFDIDSEYPLVVLETRSRASHNFYFACVSEGFKNLPENIAGRWQEVDHFRKYCLIETGWFDEQDFDFDTPKDARTFGTRFAAFCRAHDTYVRIHISGCKVIVRSAKSQSAAAMGKETFEASKKAVLDLIEHMIGVAPGTLGKEAGNAA